MDQSTNEPSTNRVSLVDSRRMLFEQIVSADNDSNVKCDRNSTSKNRVSRGSELFSSKTVNNFNSDECSGYNYSGDVCRSKADEFSGCNYSGDVCRNNADQFSLNENEASSCCQLDCDESSLDEARDADVTTCECASRQSQNDDQQLALPTTEILDAVVERALALDSETEMQFSNGGEIVDAKTSNYAVATGTAVSTAAILKNSNCTENDVADLSSNKRMSYQCAVSSSPKLIFGESVDLAPKNAISENNVGVFTDESAIPVDESAQEDRETTHVNICNLNTIDTVVNKRFSDDNTSENLTCSEDLTNTNESEPSNLSSSRNIRVSVISDTVSKSSPNYPEELNPFGEDDDAIEEEGKKHEEKSNELHGSDNTNPFGSDSESDSESTCTKLETSNTNPFWSGSDEENEDEIETDKQLEEVKNNIVKKTPIPLPRTLKKYDACLSPQFSPSPCSKNFSSTQVFPSYSSRKSSTDSSEFNFIQSPSSINSTGRKKKPAPPPPPLLAKLTNELNDSAHEPLDEQTKTLNVELPKSVSIQETRKPSLSPRKKKGPAPPRPIPLRRPVKEMPLEDIKTELSDIEVRQVELERQGTHLEDLIREKTEAESAESPAVEEMVLQLFELVNEKNEIFRRRSELMNMRKMHNLEEEHADIEYQVRCLMLRPESNKTDTDKAKEEELIKRLLEIVEKKNEIIEAMEKDRLRQTAEDESVTTQLENKTNLEKKENRGKEKKTKKSKKNTSKELKEDSKSYGNDKHFPSKLIKQKFMTLRHTAKKLHP